MTVGVTINKAHDLAELPDQAFCLLESLDMGDALQLIRADLATMTVGVTINKAHDLAELPDQAFCLLESLDMGDAL